MKSIHGDSYLDYPDARDSGELVGGDGRLPRVLAGGAASAAVQAEAEAAAEARGARGQRVGGAGIGARGRVSHPASPSGSQREGKEGRSGEDEARGVGWEWVGGVGRLEMFEQKARKKTAAIGGPAQQ
jgi:hypothetical protein